MREERRKKANKLFAKLSKVTSDTHYGLSGPSFEYPERKLVCFDWYWNSQGHISILLYIQGLYMSRSNSSSLANYTRYYTVESESNI